VGVLKRDVGDTVKKLNSHVGNWFHWFNDTDKEKKNTCNLFPLDPGE